MDKQHIKVLTTELLEDAALAAHRQNYNRQLSQEGLRQLDPKGIHLAWVLMLHEHAQGKLVPPHYRCKVLLKLRDQDLPAEVLLDTPMQNFDRWRTLQEVEAAAANTAV